MYKNTRFIPKGIKKTKQVIGDTKTNIRDRLVEAWYYFKRSQNDKYKKEDKQSDTEKVTEFYNGMPIKMYKDKNGDLHPDKSDAETVETIKERDEDRKTQKGILSSLKDIPSKIADFLGLNKDKGEKKENLLGKILDIAFKGALISAGAKLFVDKIWPVVKEPLTEFKDGLLEGLFGKSDGEGGLANKIGEKVGESIVKIKDYIFGGIPILMNGIEALMSRVVPFAIESLISNIPGILGGIFRGFKKLGGWITDAIFHRQSRLGDDAFIDTFGGIKSVSTSGDTGGYKPSSSWRVTGKVYTSGIDDSTTTDDQGNQIQNIQTTMSSDKTTSKETLDSVEKTRSGESSGPKAYLETASNRLNKYKDDINNILDNQITVENKETGESKTTTVYDVLNDSNTVVGYAPYENKDGSITQVPVVGSELLNYANLSEDILGINTRLTSDEREQAAEEAGYTHGDEISNPTTKDPLARLGRSVIKSAITGNGPSGLLNTLSKKQLRKASTSGILGGTYHTLKAGVYKTGSIVTELPVKLRDSVLSTKTVSKLQDINKKAIKETATASKGIISKLASKVKTAIANFFKDSKLANTVANFFGKSFDKELEKGGKEVAEQLSEKVIEEGTKDATKIAKVGASIPVLNIAFSVASFASGYSSAPDIAHILADDCTTGVCVLCGICNVISDCLPFGIGLFITPDFILEILTETFNIFTKGDALALNELQNKADKEIAKMTNKLGADYTLEDYNKEYKDNYSDYNVLLSDAQSIFPNDAESQNKYIEENLSKNNLTGNKKLQEKKSNDKNRKDANREFLENLAQQRIDQGIVPKGKSKEDLIKDIAAEMQMEGMYATGTPYVSKSGLYALSEGEYIIPRLAEGTIGNIPNIKDKYTFSSSKLSESMQNIFDYATSGDDKFFRKLSDNSDSSMKMIDTIAKRVFTPVYAIEKMQRYIIEKFSNETGDGDKVLEKFNKSLADTNKYLTGKASMKNYWNDSLDDDTSMYGNMAKVMSTIHKTLLFPMLMTKSLFQGMSGQKGSGTVDAVSTNNTTTDTTVSDLNSTTVDTTSESTTKKNTKNSKSIIGIASSTINTIKEKASNVKNTIANGISKLFGKGAGFVGAGSEMPTQDELSTPNSLNTKVYKYTDDPKVKSLSTTEINKITLDKVSSTGDNFVSQTYGNISNAGFNTSLDNTKQTVSDSGCAPAAATMVINSLRGKSTIDMNKAVKDALPFKVPNSGVSSNYFDNEFAKYGIGTDYIENINYNNINKSPIVKAINENRPTILLGQDVSNTNKNVSPFGSSPHYVVADSISKDGKYIYINDPESRTPRTRYDINKVLPKVTVGITTYIGNKVKKAANKLKMYVGGARKQVKAPSGDFIGKNVKEFESGNKGPNCVGQCGNDGGGSYGSYQMIYKYDGKPGSAQTFWSQYFASKYGIQTSAQDLKTKWIQAVKDIGEDEFFAKEWEFMLANYYKPTVNALKKLGFDPDNYSRAMQDCIWSWCVHRGSGGCVSEFTKATAGFSNVMEVDETTLLNACYNTRAGQMSGKYSDIGSGRYGTGSSSERAKILGLVGQDPIDYTAPDGVLASGATPGSDISEGSTNDGGEKSIIDILLSPFDIIANKFKLTGGVENSTSLGTDSVDYNSDGISGKVSSDPKIAEKQVQLVAKMKSVYEKLKYSQSNRDPDTGSGDCSSTVNWAYKKVTGVDIGGWSGAQAESGNTFVVDKGNNSSGQTDESKLQLGDIVLYGTNADAHAEMYAGNGKVLSHGNSKKLGPSYANLNRRNDYWGTKRLNAFKSSGTSTFTGSGSGLVGKGSFVSQLDPRYANKEFNIPGDTTKQTIGDSGCAPAAATMVLNDIYGNGSGMLDSAKLALKYKQNNDGVSSDYFQDIYSRNGLNTNYYNRKEQVANDLRRGKDVVLLGSDKKNTSKTNSPFGPNPHYVVASGMSKDGKSITIKDPESKSPKKYNTSKILNSTKLGIGYGSGLNKIKSKLKKFVGRGIGQFSGILYVGDSRTDMMKDCISEDGVYFISKVGAGLAWLKSTAASQVKSKIQEDSNLAVVFNFGVNDLYNASNYINWYKQFEKDNPDAKIYFMSVNPVDKDPDGYATDADVQKFNVSMQSYFGNRYLDVYSYLKASGYKTTDGLHYDNDTSKKIHEKVKEMLGGASSTINSNSTSSNTTSVLDAILGSFGNLASAYGLTYNTTTSNTSSTGSLTNIGPGSTYPTYDLTDSQLNDVATCITGETGGTDIVASMQEASQMANLNEVTYGKSNTGSNLYNSLHGGWYAKDSWTRGVTDTAIQAAKSVLVEGKRVLPRYVTEHDTFPMDIKNAKDRSDYNVGDSVSNRYGSNYKFYDFFGKNRDGDISGYFQKDYDKYSGDQPWSVGSGSGLLGNRYLKNNTGRGTEDVLSALGKYTEELSSSVANVNNTNNTVSTNTNDTISLLKSIIKLLAQIVDNTKDVSEIVEILSKIVSIQSTDAKGEFKKDLVSLKSQLVNKLNSYNRTNNGSSDLSTLMNSIENLAME